MSRVLDNRVIAGADVLKIAQQLREAAEQVAAPPPHQDSDQLAGLQDVIIPLSDFNNGNGSVIARNAPEFKGAAVIFRRDGSHPGARLDVIAGGKLTAIAPGTKFTVPMQGCTLALSGLTTATTTGWLPLTPISALCATGSAAGVQGNLSALMKPVCRFTLCRDVSYDLSEPKLSMPQQPGMMLLGRVSELGAITYETVAEDTDPSAIPFLGFQTGAFEVTGWRRVRVLINTLTAAANATSFDLVPWFNSFLGTQIWYEQGTARISVPDSDTSGALQRVVEFDLDGGYGFMYLAVRNLQAAARTGLNIAVMGVE